METAAQALRGGRDKWMGEIDYSHTESIADHPDFQSLVCHAMQSSTPPVLCQTRPSRSSVTTRDLPKGIHQLCWISEER